MIRRNPNRKMTLESRVARLESILKTRRKFEQSNKEDIFTDGEAEMFCKLLKNRRDISVIECDAEPGVESWFVVIADPDGENETEFSVYKFDDGHVEAWRDSRSRYSEPFGSVEECAGNIEPYDTSLWGDEYY